MFPFLSNKVLIIAHKLLTNMVWTISKNALITCCLNWLMFSSISRSHRVLHYKRALDYEDFSPLQSHYLISKIWRVLHWKLTSSEESGKMVLTSNRNVIDSKHIDKAAGICFLDKGCLNIHCSSMCWTLFPFVLSHF